MSRGPRPPAPGAGRAALAVALLAAATLRCSEATAPADAARAETITAADMRRWVERLADDSMRGRATPSPEIERAATTLGAYLAGLRLLPAFPAQAFVAHFPAPPYSVTDSAPLVGAVLRGSDPALADEYVVVVAHLDAKGLVTPVGTDSICNGADDNASGSAGVLELAEAFAGTAPHPRRSLLFLLVSGEEHGLWGSQWYVDHPSVPLASIVAVVNLDMISRNDPGALQVGGLDLSTLGTTVAQAALAHPEVRLTLSPGQTTGSDQVPFWSKGIPFVFLFAGLHADYHRPTDEPATIDADKAARVARLAFFAALTTANADARPEWLTAAAPPAAAREHAP